jgi:hypothetical protein
MPRGRKAKTGKREASGRLSRKAVDVAARLNDAHDKEERDMLSVGLEARVRVHGIEPAETRNQMAGSFIGRLCLQRTISRAQYDAAMEFLDANDQYQWAMGSPRSPGAVNLNAIRGAAASKENIPAARQATNRYELALKAVTEKQIELRGTANLYAALQYLVIEDKPLEHMVGDLRTALNALAKHYGLAARVAA